VRSVCGAGSRKERILSVVLDPGGLGVELGDEEVDNEVYGYGPTQDFIRAVAKEIRFQIRNTGGLGEHSTLRRVHRRFQRGLEKRGKVCCGKNGGKIRCFTRSGDEPKINSESPTSRIAGGSFPEDPYVALEEVSRMLGLSESEVRLLLTLLGKADDGYLSFHLGNICIEFINRSFDEKGMILDIDVEKGNMSHSVKYLLKTRPKDMRANDADTE